MHRGDVEVYASKVTRERVAWRVHMRHALAAEKERHEHDGGLAGGDPLGEAPVGLRVHMLVRAKPEKEQERGRRAEKRAQKEGRQLKWNQVESLHKLDKFR